MRYQPPLQTKDQNGQFAELARVLDAREPPAAYAVARGTSVQVGAGETRRLAPRAAGMTAIIPAADETNYGALITLLVDSALGATRVAPVSGTINGAASFTISAGYKSLLVLMSDGDGRWLTERAEGFPLTNGDKGDITVSGNGDNWQIDASAVGTAELAASAVTTAKIADNNVTNAKLATMSARRVKGREDGVAAGDPQDLVGAEVGEIVRFNSTQTDTASTGTIVTYTVAEGTNVIRFNSGVAATTLRGATIPGESGQFVVWENNDGTGVTITFNHEDGSAAAAGNRFRCPGSVNYALTAGHRIITVYFADRWRIVGDA